MTSPTPHNDSSIALALSGGGAAGLGHIHVFEALDQLGLKPIAIAGTSMGAIIGAAYAAGMTGREIREHVIDLADSPIKSVQRFIKNSFIESPLSMGALDPVAAVQTIMPLFLPNTIEELKIPFTAVATDLHGHQPLYLKAGPLIPAIAASMAIPGIFKPTSVAGRICIDGGVTDNLPIEQLPHNSTKIAVDTVGFPPSTGNRIPNQLAVMMASMRLLMRTLHQHKLMNHPSTFVIEPESRQYQVLDFHKAKNILNSGNGTIENTKRTIAEALENPVFD